MIPLEAARRRRPPISPFTRQLRLPARRESVSRPLIIPRAILKHLQLKKGTTMPTAQVAKDTLIVVVIDKSGSMEGRRDEVTSGFNQFVEEQRKVPGNATMSVVFFDTNYQTPVVNIPLERINLLDRTNYVPGGMTALLDAVGRAIKTTDQSLGERQAIVVIVTDGQENSSREFSRETIKTMIEERTAKGWDFIYLGAGQDAFSEAGGIGIAHANVANYSSAVAGQTVGTFTASSEAVRSKRMTGAVSMDWKYKGDLDNPDAAGGTATTPKATSLTK